MTTDFHSILSKQWTFIKNWKDEYISKPPFAGILFEMKPEIEVLNLDDIAGEVCNIIA